MTKRAKIVTLAMVLIAIFTAGFFLAERTFYAIGDGRYKLKVTVRSKDDRAIRKIECMAWFAVMEGFDNPAAEAQISSKFSFLDHIHTAAVDDFMGQPFEVDVAFTVHQSFTGRVLYSSQFKHLHIIATYADGKRVFRVFDIPDRKESTAMTIELP